MRTSTLILFFALIRFYSAIAQDIDFNQWQANYMSLNPAMTGISNNPRLHFANRSSFTYFTGPAGERTDSRTTMISYDQRISPKAGYIGISYLNDVIGNARIGTQAVILNYARDYTIDIVAKAGRKRFESDGNL